MRSCFSSDGRDFSIHRRLTANVIALNGSLRECPVPITASEVLGADLHSCFLCSSDRLFIDAYIPAVDPGASLRRGPIYFVLPVSKLDYPLSGSDMAALAIKASTALSSVPEKRRRLKRRIRVGPVMVLAQSKGDGDRKCGFPRIEKFNNTRSSNSRTIQRRRKESAWMKARMVHPVRPFVSTLSTINEAAE